jgi:uncharacterized protein
VEITFDQLKNARNILERGISFESVRDFNFKTAIYSVDGRKDYGEKRWRSLGTVFGRVHALVFVETATGIRVISFRKANAREVRYYEKTSESQ